MASIKPTIFQSLTQALITGFDKNLDNQAKKVNSYNFNQSNDVIYKTKNPEELATVTNQMKQQQYLANQWVGSGKNLGKQSSLVTSNLKLMYRDADLMDSFPEVGAALDLFSEESCLYSDTYIKLLNGSTLTIEELFKNDYKDFWVYSIDENGVDCKPTKIEKVICNGIKPLLKITLDDGTEIKCTENHKWLLSNNTWVESENINEGDSLMSIYDSLNYKGYERVISTNGTKLEMTHKMVAENILHDEKVKLSKERVERNEPYEKIVIHHKSFNKLNNDPNELVYMYWVAHQKLHTDLNTSRWENKEFADKMRKIMSDSIKKTWATKRDELIEKLTEGQKIYISLMTKEERDIRYGLKGEKNGMYGTHRTGSLNPNYNKTKNHIEDINEDEYISFLLTCCTTYKNTAMVYFNLLEKDVIKLNNTICKKYNIRRVDDLKYKLDPQYSITLLKEIIRNNKNETKYSIGKKTGISRDRIEKIIKINNYNSFDDLVKSVNNHRVIKIEKCGEGNVYDLVNSSNNNCFGVKCNTGQIISHNCTTNNKGQILNISSKSSRVKNVLEDLFVNRLDGHVNIPMWVRAMCKYGNCFNMLNITAENGVIGARMLPVYEIDRVESGMYNPYVINNASDTSKDTGTVFAWAGSNGVTNFQNWQIAHFRLLTDSIFLPYGVSALNKGRRHWRILSMMEDMMLIYRLERSIERRVYKIFVGNIDDADIPAYINDIANSFKRTPIIDPLTGQIDLKKASIGGNEDIFMPYKDDATSSKIETLSPASNLDKIEDLSYIQNKLMVALRVPAAFLNFEQGAGNGKNLALLDIRFTRTINRIQQSLIMELTKIAAIHLYTIGLGDELNNFKITMNSPSTQSEILKLEETTKKIALITDATRDIGNGMQIMSLTRCQREILGWSDEEISENMLEVRMERALASELTKTDQIIKRTGFFDKIDKLYGEPDADYISDNMEPGGDMGGGGAGGGGGASFDDTFGGGGDEMGGMEGAETAPSSEGGGGELPPVENTPIEATQQAPAMESYKRNIDKLLVEAKSKQIQNIVRQKESYFDSYMKHINTNKLKIQEEAVNATPIVDKAFLINEETMGLVGDLDKLINGKQIDLSLDEAIEKPKKTSKSKKIL